MVRKLDLFNLKEKKMAEVHQRGLWVKIFLLLAVLSAPLATGSSVAWAQTIFVTSTADSGAGSLRQAILDANADAAANAILFDTSALSCPIAVFVTSSQLPALTGPGDTIDGSACGVTLDGSTLTGASDDGLRVRASNITIRGLTIQEFPREGIRVEPLPNLSDQIVMGVVVSKNTIRENGADGLRVSGQTGAANTSGNKVGAIIINNEVIRNGDDGIFVAGSIDSTGGHTVDVVINNNLIRGSRGVKTGGTTSGDGIRVVGGSDGSNNGVTAIISNNRVENNVDDGILVAGAGGGPGSNNIVFTEIVNNIVRKSGAAASLQGNGIRIRGGSSGTATSTGTGISVTFVVANNKSQNSKDHGINVGGGLGSSHTVKGSVSDNDVSDSGIHGIRVHGESGTTNTVTEITIKGNRSRNNGIHGIGLFQGSASNAVSVTGITDNTINNNGQDGIFVASGVPGSGATPVSANTANNNGEDGIDLNSTGYVVLANTANDNAGAGIDAVGNIDGGGNTASGNATCNTPGCF